jgi:glutathione synthase/RimK-type ligase-like ATP-grasp enzyme
MPTRPVLSADFDAHVGRSAFLGLSALLRRAFSGEDVSQMGPELIERAQRDSDPYAMLDLSTVLQLHYQRDAALTVLAEALKTQVLYRVAGKGQAGALRILALKSPGDLMSNTPFECLLDAQDVTVDVLYVQAGSPLPDTLPDHDVLLMAIGESDRNAAVLGELAETLAQWPRPVLNPAACVPRLARDAASARFAEIAGVVMPSTVRCARQLLQRVAEGETLGLTQEETFPLIVRPLGSHAGAGLDKVDGPTQLAAYLAEHDDAQYYVAPFVDYASPDGLFRKYRVVMIGGQPHLCHMGISRHWMVHYPYDEMVSHAARRDEEQQAMRDFAQAPRGLAARHREAFDAFDYWGMDCAETQQGELLVFEVTNAMVIHAMDPADLFPYKQAQMKTVFDAFYRMMLSRAGRPAPGA